MSECVVQRAHHTFVSTMAAFTRTIARPIIATILSSATTTDPSSRDNMLLWLLVHLRLLPAFHRLDNGGLLEPAALLLQKALRLDVSKNRSA
eukprot:92762-Pyramimonas_sp.AAC.1